MPKEVILTANAGKLAIQPNAICQLVMTKIFFNQVRLIEGTLPRSDSVQISLKLWNTWIWHACIDDSNTTSVIHESGRVAH